MTAQRTSGSLVSRLPISSGAAAGVVAYLAGYLLTYLLVEVDGELDPEQPLEQVGMLFYNAHFVDTVLTGEALGETGTSSENVLRNATTQLPEAAYFAVPVVVLVVAGFAAVRLGSRLTAPADGAVGGSLIALGAFPFSILGVLVFETTGSFLFVDGSAAPDLVTGILLVGIVYPVVFGGVGGLLATLAE